MEGLRNVEVKGYARDPGRTLEAAAALSDAGAPTAVLEQRDSYYEAREGRLKLRRQKNKDDKETLQLVHYSRPDSSEAKLSEYSLCSLEPSCADALHATLAKALGHRGDVVKTRRLFLAGQTRIHVDEVVGLGDYFELEVVLRPEQTVDEGGAIADDVLSRLRIDPGDLLSGSYVDLLLKK